MPSIQTHKHTKTITRHTAQPELKNPTIKMVKLSTIALAFASTLPLASAKACNTGLIYCGFNLKRIGTPPALRQSS